MKKIIISVSIAFLVGSIFALILFKNIDHNIETVFMGYEEITFFQAGVFTTKENADSFAKSMKSAMVAEDEGFYRVYIAILTDEENIAIMQEHFDAEKINYYLRKVNIKDSEFLTELKKYEKIMASVSEEDTYDAINKKILNIYKKVV